jgi:hypothetical protein
MQFIQRLLGLTGEEEKQKPPELDSESIPRRNL